MVIEENPVLRGGEQAHQSVKSDGVCTALCASMGMGGGYIPMIVENKIRQIGNLAEKEGGRRNPSCGRVYDTGGISPALNTMQGGGREPHIVAMRGRNPENPGARENGLKTEQRLEMKMDGTSNTLTTVQKDKVVLENKPEAVNLYDESGKETSFQERVYRSEKISPAVTASFRPSYLHKYRIRKLTPKECFRLMAVTDDDADKMLAVNSNSQCYKQAGNSIVVSVLEAIFRQLNIKGVENWNKAKGEYGNVRNSL